MFSRYKKEGAAPKSTGEGKAKAPAPAAAGKVTKLPKKAAPQAAPATAKTLSSDR